MNKVKAKGWCAVGRVSNMILDESMSTISEAHCWNLLAQAKGLFKAGNYINILKKDWNVVPVEITEITNEQRS